MKQTFDNRLAAIEWIANHAEHEGHFEVLREQLSFNYIYTNTYFIEIDEDQVPDDIVLINPKQRR